MKHVLLVSLITLSLCYSCSSANLETPFMVVVKLKSAEEHLKFDEAKKYIDIDAVYSHYKKGDENLEKEWEEFLRFNYLLGQDKKFTNSFNYSLYDISESINNGNAKVEFIPTDLSDKKITYYLELRDKLWIVVRIDYDK